MFAKRIIHYLLGFIINEAKPPDYRWQAMVDSASHTHHSHLSNGLHGRPAWLGRKGEKMDIEGASKAPWRGEWHG